MDETKGLATDDPQQDDPYADMRASKPWLEDIKDAEAYFQDYQDKCDNIDKVYANLKQLSGENAEREMQIFWANLEVLKPSIYARPPVPVVASRFKDRKAINRHASEILERSLVTSFDMQDIHESMKLVRDDLATNARGVIWPRYEANEDQSHEIVEYDHLDRKDFLHGQARKWKEVPWVAKRTWQTMEQMRNRFQQSSGDAYLSADYAQRKDKNSEAEYSGEKKACVWEVWHKTKNVVVWVSPGVDVVLDIMPPFLTLDRFFPCPRPAYGTLERGTLKPVPDFLFYKDQIEEINEFTARISALAESLRLKGFYSAGGEDVATAIETAIKQNDNNALLVPVPNVAAFGSGSGTFKDSILWLPVDQVAAVIVQLISLRRQMIEDVYQVTGLSDIMRGSTDPNETLGAQELKSQYGSIRIRDRQEEMIRIGRDCGRIAGEIMAENFAPATMVAMSQYDEVPTQQQVQQQIDAIKQQVQQAASNPQMIAQAQQNPQMAQQMLDQAQQQIASLQGQVTLEQVFQFLRDQRMRPFSLDIETDSTIQADENAAKQATNEFLGAMATALQQLGPMIQMFPQSSEFAGEVLKFAVAPYRAGRALESAIDNFVDQMKQQSSQPKPNPEADKANAEIQLQQAEQQRKAQESQTQMQIAMQESQAELAKTQAEITKIATEIDQLKAERRALAISTASKVIQPQEPDV